MFPLKRSQWLSQAVVALLLGLASVVMAGPPLPEIPKGKGEQCVEPTQDIRKNHMNYLLHHRDETMHRGIRTKRHSLKQCIECHVQPDANGVYPQVGTKEHFCSSCHIYAAVKVDCFQCHAGRPDSKSPSTAIGKGLNDEVSMNPHIAARPSSEGVVK